MDTSETYIKMCGKAKELKLHRGLTKASVLAFLPRQNQLQEMVVKPLWELNGCFFEWLFSSTSDGWHINHEHLSFTSMEQLWLAFVMKEKYNKSWDGNNWVQIKK